VIQGGQPNFPKISSMNTIESLSDAIRIVHFHIAERRGWEDTKKRRNMICWRDEKGGMIGPRRIWITEYAKDVYRVKGGLESDFIKSVWPFDVPNQMHFELTLHASEITREFVNELLPLVAASFDSFNEVPSVSLYQAAKGFPSYAWTAKAEKTYEAQRQRAGHV
jgi:hypothetical protein